MPTGDALLSGYYLNELLMRLMARDDAHPALFDAYSSAVQVLASEHGDALEPALRAFELLLLREVGLLPSLDHETLTLAPVQEDARYSLVPEAGLVPWREEDGRASLTGSQWRNLQQAMQAPVPFSEAIVHTAGAVGPLKSQLRTLLHYHCGVSTLRTRQLMIDLQDL